MLMCLDLPYYCDINTQTVQSQEGVIIVFKPLGDHKLSATDVKLQLAVVYIYCLPTIVTFG